MKMFCCWWSFKPTVSPVVTMAIHTFVQWAFGFSYVLFVATAARDQIHNILCCAVCVLSQSYSGPRRWLHSASRGYHFAALTSFSATGSTFTSLVVIIRVWFESCSYQEITKAFGASNIYICICIFIIFLFSITSYRPQTAFCFECEPFAPVGGTRWFFGCGVQEPGQVISFRGIRTVGRWMWEPWLYSRPIN